MKKPKPTKELAERIARRIVDGVGVERAITLEGVNKTTAHRWRRLGRADDAAGIESDNAMFHRSLEAAIAEMLAGCESYLHQAMFDENVDERDKIKLTQWKLTKLARADYGDKSEIVIRGEIESMCEAARPLMTASAYSEMIHAFASLAGLDSGAGEGDEHEDEDPLPLH